MSVWTSIRRHQNFPRRTVKGLGIVGVKGKKRLKRHEMLWPGNMPSMGYHGHKNSRRLVNFQSPILSLSSKRFSQTFGANYTEPSNLAQLFILVDFKQHNGESFFPACEELLEDAPPPLSSILHRHTHTDTYPCLTIQDFKQGIHSSLNIIEDALE